ncbi:glycoside hydrolase family 16 protein [Granulosicoccus antarcticus]|uniref:glycoside hydrolase family 16 protein n=1 Tax=Granulosicoccus antarcticus TaxID=437505 RepID=UPI0012FD560B|nr:glycoside hydrolase family 16 protein [Granulosicoccus antarcticus]
MAYAIDAPQDPRGTEVAQSTVKWEWASVPGAAHYEISIDGNYEGITRDPQYFSRNLWQGDHSMQVRAIEANGTSSVSTNTVKITVNSQFNASSVSRSTVIGGTQQAASSNNNSVVPVSRNASSGFTAPGDGRGTEDGNGSIVWSWGSVEGASTYEVTVDGAYAGETSELLYTSSNLWVGEHSLTVKAVDANGLKSVQSETFKANVTTLGNGRSSSGVLLSDSTAPPPEQIVGDESASSVQSLIDPASYNYSETSQKSGYELVFSDEFNGTALNPYRWHSQLRWDGEFNGERYEYRVINGEDQFYVNVLSPDSAHTEKVVPVYNPFQFNGSTLSIRAAKNPLQTNTNKRTYGSLDEMSAQQTFLSGAISTHEKFSQKYGYFEARIKIPSHVGTFPAFWLFHENRAWEGTQRTEIDIMENLGHAPWYIYNSFHYFKNVTATYSGDANFIKPSPSGQVYTGKDYSEDYHVYAVDWTPGTVVWYIDGVETSRMVNNEANFEELYVMLNLAMGGNWTNFPANSGGLGRDSNNRYPNANDLVEFSNPALEIDYVRVYKKQ